MLTTGPSAGAWPWPASRCGHKGEARCRGCELPDGSPGRVSRVLFIADPDAQAEAPYGALARAPRVLYLWRVCESWARMSTMDWVVVAGSVAAVIGTFAAIIAAVFAARADFF